MKNRVYALVDQTGDGRADQMTVLLPNVYWPNGIAWRNNSLYISGFYNERWVPRRLGGWVRGGVRGAGPGAAICTACPPHPPAFPPRSGTMLGFIAKYDDIDQYALKNQVG
jgi:hypothetical protein